MADSAQAENARAFRPNFQSWVVLEATAQLETFLLCYCFGHSGVALVHWVTIELTALTANSSTVWLTWKHCIRPNTKAAHKKSLEQAIYWLTGVVKITLRTPTANYTIRRTFKPTVDAFYGSDTRDTLPPNVEQVAENYPTMKPEFLIVLQHEIANLDSKFKVNFDPTALSNEKCAHLICCLQDKLLPTVPPIRVIIPDTYPHTSPNCAINDSEYSATPFLKAVKDALLEHFAKMPKIHSLSHILGTWEMAVRQACLAECHQCD